jgi:hypothetical protein
MGNWGAPLPSGTVSSSSYAATGKGHLYGTLMTPDGDCDPCACTHIKIWVADLITLHAPTAAAVGRSATKRGQPGER